MTIDYHDLNDDQFERLVIAICSYLLGLGVQGFSTGPDGGKDARFVGRAERFPSSSAPLDGRMVIQAKHTELINCKFSEPDFSSDASSSVISEELPRIQNLRTAGELDYYLLFSNRRLAGVAEEKIRKRIASAAGIDESSVWLFGEEALDQYLTWEPDILRRAGIHQFDILPSIDPGDLARVIKGLAEGHGAFCGVPAEAATPPPEQRISLTQKNLINGLSEDYAQRIRRYIKDFESDIRPFLAAPENSSYLRYYTDTVEELEGFILTHREERHSFDQVLERLFKLLIDRDYDLKANKKLTRIVFYYMYWNCDLGSDHDA
ncbi:MAG: hypothetical protein Q7U97_02000 [Rhodocyclaceae bacterium]|nr:hypothetical protein [Rhodocyclaceae bacterium]